MQAQLALGRRKLTLWASPVATLRHFCASAGAACLRGALWLAQHPLTLFMGVPFVAAWLFLKQTGQWCASHRSPAHGGCAHHSMGRVFCTQLQQPLICSQTWPSRALQPPLPIGIPAGCMPMETKTTV